MFSEIICNGCDSSYVGQICGELIRCILEYHRKDSSVGHYLVDRFGSIKNINSKCRTTAPRHNFRFVSCARKAA